VIQSSAYNLFYRRRDWHEKNLESTLDFEALSIKPDMSYIKKPEK